MLENIVLNNIPNHLWLRISKLFLLRKKSYLLYLIFRMSVVPSGKFLLVSTNSFNLMWKFAKELAEICKGTG